MDGLVRRCFSKANKKILHALSGKLTKELGKDYTMTNLFNMVRFAETFPDPKILHTLCAKLSWTHFRQMPPSTAYVFGGERGCRKAAKPWKQTFKPIGKMPMLRNPGSAAHQRGFFQSRAGARRSRLRRALSPPQAAQIVNRNS